ncbi:hypothetical protein [Haloprofundus halobius]|uniref:hypothetical protein n=1 Tax=Haloprofundus halobius TaxID=2876194 RepID=UPI001CCA49CE|nr:hypothetical protein [Haloprofundus halobius]
MFSSPWTLVLAVGLAAVHLEAERLRAAVFVSRRVWVSFAGGTSLAYVFVHVFPELNAGQAAIREANIALAFVDHHVYLVALGGFTLCYGLETAAKTPNREADTEEPDSVFWIHVLSFASYNVIIGYLLVHTLDPGLWTRTTFGVAMALHFFVTDAGFRRHHPRPYHRLGRWILAGAVLGGWVLGQLVDLSEVNLAVLFAFLAGSIVLNVVKEELPDRQQSKFVAFVVGATGYATLLLLL